MCTHARVLRNEIKLIYQLLNEGGVGFHWEVCGVFGANRQGDAPFQGLRISLLLQETPSEGVNSRYSGGVSIKFK